MSVVEAHTGVEQKRQPQNGNYERSEPRYPVGNSGRKVAIGKPRGLAGQNMHSLMKARIGAIDPTHEDRISDRPAHEHHYHQEEDSPLQREEDVLEHPSGKVC
jgi:hypothetical protein